MSGFFTSVASILKTVTHRHGIDLKLLEYQLRDGWREIVGPQIAAHSRPDHIRFKKLYLVVESSVWLQHLTFLKPVLLEKLHDATGDQTVADIVLRVGEIPQEDKEVRSSTCDVEPRTPNPEPRTDLLKEAAAMTASVTDPDLRERLAELMVNLLDRGR